jgi:S-adenosylmethionine-diacylgycerolhomoserine-N-methlytransferase
MRAAATAAEKMDAIYRRQRYIYDATRRYYLLGRDRLIASLKPPPGGAVLEAGCGTARNLIQAAKRYPDARFHGLDISEAMLKSARASVSRHGLRARVVLGQGDATAFQPAALFGRDGFDRIYVSYSLSMIPVWEDAVRHLIGQLAPRGELHILDFGDFARYPALLRRAQLAWLRRFSVVPIPGMQGKISGLAEEAGLTATAESLYGGYSIQMRLCR